MKITGVKVFKNEKRYGSFIGNASVTLDEVFTIGDIAILEKDGQIFASFPQKDLGKDYKDFKKRFKTILFIKNPLNQEIRDAAIDAFNKEFGNIIDSKEETLSNKKKNLF